MAGLFVTGTGTDVGKTMVTATLLWQALQMNLPIAPMKPIQTGTDEDPNGQAPDFEFYKRATGYAPNPQELPLQVPYTYEPPCSPHLAAQLDGSYPDVGHILTCARQLEERYDLVLAEGAGGLLVPIDEELTMRDLIKLLGYPVLVVAHVGLGTINHTLLTLEALQAAECNILGVVLCAPEPWQMGFIEADNPRTIARISGLPVFGTLPYYPTLAENSTEALTHAAQAMQAEHILKQVLS